MKLHFSLSTLLICIGVSAVALSYCMNLPVREVNRNWQYRSKGDFTINEDYYFTSNGVDYRPPHRDEVCWRLAWAEPLALLATLAAIQAVKFVWSKARHEKNADEP